MFELSFLFGLAVAFFGMMTAHWFPWPGDTHVMVRYIVGTVGIVAGAAIWLLPIGHANILYGVMGVAAAAGLGTAAGYGIDKLANIFQKAKLHDNAEQR